MSEHGLTFADAIRSGELGDKPIDVRLTIRELAAVEYLVTTAMNTEAPEAAQLGADLIGIGDRWNLAFQSAQIRMGLALSRAFGEDEHASTFIALLADLDQQQAALNTEEGPHGH